MNGLSPEKAKKLKEALPIRARLAWQIGEETGLRISDILNLNKKDVRSGVWVTKERKTGKYKICRISPATIHLAETYMTAFPTPHKRKLFFNMETRKPFTRQSIYKSIRATSNRLKIDFIGAHSTRATFAQNLKRSGLSLEDIQKAMNHKSAETTKHYLSNRRKRRKLPKS